MKITITILLACLSLTIYGQEYTTCSTLDSLIWKKVNEYRTTEDAIAKAYGVPNTITEFGLGEMREYCYKVTKMNAQLSFEDMRHSTYEELTPTANGECLYKHRRTSTGEPSTLDLTCDTTLEYLANKVVTGWINSWTHRTVIGWRADNVSTVTTLFSFIERGIQMDVTYHAKE